MSGDRIRAYGFDFVDMLRKHWAVKGTASYPVVFRTPDGNEWVPTDVVRTEGKETVVLLDGPR